MMNDVQTSPQPTPSSSSNSLSADLLERVLLRLGLSKQPEPTLEGLTRVYSAWCQRVPFDNVRKIIHIRSAAPGALPGTSAGDFFEAWLKFGTGGTCWAGAGACYTLLKSLGFDASRGIGTMLAAPSLPPNHGTVMVSFNKDNYLVDSSILHGEPLPLVETGESRVAHPAWGVRAFRRDGRTHISWRPLHKVDGFECRLERFGAEREEYEALYQATRGWSAFNYELTARINRGQEVVGASFGHSVRLSADGSVQRNPMEPEDRKRILIEEIGIAEEIVSQLPPDVPTPPPPGSRTAMEGL